MAKTMKAAVVRAFGKPLEMEELPIQLLVRAKFWSGCLPAAFVTPICMRLMAIGLSNPRHPSSPAMRPRELSLP